MQYSCVKCLVSQGLLREDFEGCKQPQPPQRSLHLLALLLLSHRSELLRAEVRGKQKAASSSSSKATALSFWVARSHSALSTVATAYVMWLRKEKSSLNYRPIGILPTHACLKRLSYDDMHGLFGARA